MGQKLDKAIDDATEQELRGRRPRGRRAGRLDPEAEIPLPDGGTITFADLYAQAQSDLAKGAVVAPFTAAPDLLGLMQDVRDPYGVLPVDISGDPIRELVGLDPSSGTGMLGELAFPQGAVAKAAKGLGATMAAMPLAGRVRSLDEARISTRNPTGKTATEDPLAEDLRVDVETLLSTPASAEKATEVFRKYEMYRDLPRDPAEAIQVVTDLHMDNLRWLMSEVPDDVLERSAKWYEGANIIAQDLSRQYDVTAEAAAGVLAALSPKTEWFTNVSSAERVLQALSDQGSLKWTRQLADKFDEMAPNISNPAARAALTESRGKALADIEDPIEKAVWLRAWDEVNLPRTFREVSPEGAMGDVVRSQKTGEPLKFGGWGVGIGPIAKAVKIAEDPQMAVISSALGRNHKIRSFYNNIIAPLSDAGDVTIDTHAVSANMLQPLGQSSTPVAHAFGGTNKGIPGAGGSAITGVQGTYPIHAEAVRRLAEEQNFLPREVQSMTWEAVRGLFDQKTPRAKAQAARIWEAYNAGQITANEAREAIAIAGRGLKRPAWAR